jgi:putative ABC transport system permease protein
VILRDQFRYAFDNLRRTRLRTVLTAAGVAIGIGAMTSMVSVGNGTQRNVLRAVNEQYVLTSVMVQPADSTENAGDTTRSLDSAAVAAFRDIPGVRDAYPVIALPGLLVARGERLFQSLEGMPAWLLAEQVERGRVEIIAGHVYREGDTAALVLSERAARRLLPDSTPPDSLVGTEVQFLVAQAASEAAPAPPMPSLDPQASLLPLVARSVGRFQPTTLSLTVVGIIKGGGTFGDFVGLSLWVPMETVEPLHANAFQDLGSLLTGETQGGGYGLVQVLTGSVMSVRQVQDSIAAMGFRARSILDEIAEIRRAFVIMNGLLAMIGGVSLAVAAMMIVNTLVMAVLERTREIGLLKSMGATDTDVMRLFLTEAGVIGLLGGGTGLVLGYGVARITNFIANVQFERVGEIKVNLVAFPAWLIAGGLAFAVVVSLAAGFYPARRAAKVDPVVALRHF